MKKKWRWVRYVKYLVLVISLLSSTLIPFLLDHIQIESVFLEKNGWWLIAVSILLSVIIDFIWDTIVNKDNGYTKGDTESLIKFIDHELEQIHGRYSKIIYTEYQEVVPIIRINLMILTKKDNREFMQIHACYTPNSSDAYSTHEKEIEWYYGLGCCGKAWKSKESRQYDKYSTESEIFKEGLSPEQLNYTKHVTSILSTPILDADKVVAILNIDSPEPINVVKFQDVQISRTIREEARMLTSIIHAPILLTDGARVPKKGKQYAKQKRIFSERKKS